MKNHRQDLHFTHAIGNALILTAFLLVVASTAYFSSKGMELEQAYAEILGNSLVTTTLAAMIIAGATLPLGDTKKDRQAKLTSLTNRSLVSMFMTNMMLIPALGIISSVQIFLLLDIILLTIALASSALQLKATTRKTVLTTIVEVFGCLLIVFAAVVQMLTADMLPMQIQERSWTISIFAIVLGIILLFISRKMQRSNLNKPNGTRQI
ncbi:MAG: hypothetical protein ACUVTL_07830 [Thermoproteota archaeon]